MKMIRNILTCLLVTVILSPSAYGQNKSTNKLFICADILSVAEKGILDIEFGYGFAKQWSASGNIAFDLHIIGKEKSTEERDHDEKISDSSEETKDNIKKIFNYGGIDIRYWPDTIWKGPYICLGGIIHNSDKPDICIGGGYLIRIWKGLSIDVRMRRRIMEENNEIKAGISYIF